MNDIERRVTDLERRMYRLEEFILYCDWPNMGWNRKSILNDIGAEHAAQSATGQAPAPEMPEVPSVERLAAELVYAQYDWDGTDADIDVMAKDIKEDTSSYDYSADLRMARRALALLRPAPAPPTAGGPDA